MNAFDAERRCDCYQPNRRAVPSVAINGLRYDPVTREELLSAFGTFRRCGRSHIVHFFAAHPSVLARADAEYRALANDADLNVPDGVGVEWALRFLGYSAARRIAGTEGLHLACRWGLENNIRHYFFGGTPEATHGLRSALERAYPTIRIAGMEAPPFRPLTTLEWREAAVRMQQSEADIVWIGLGVPKQDDAAIHLRRERSAPIIACIGAAFDFVSGAKRRAPAPMQKAGLEWAYRLASDPHRLWWRYLVGNPRFVAGVIRDYRQVRSRP